MDLLTTLTAARRRAADAPHDPSAWLGLAELLEVADRGALDADAAFVLAVDRSEALARLVALVPTAEHLRAQVTSLAALAPRARERGHRDVAAELHREGMVAARLWMRVDRAPEPAAAALVDAARGAAEHALAMGDRDAAAAAFTAMLEGLYLLAHRTGRPEHALRLAGVHLHLAAQLAGEGEARQQLLRARDLLDQLDAAGLSHPVQADVRAEVEERLAALAGT